MANNKKYTYVNFCEDVTRLLNGEEVADKNAVAEKCNALMASLEKKAEYNKEHPKASSAKGASDKTKALAEKVKNVLNGTPKTGAEISAEVGEELTALQIANAIRFIEGVKSEKVKRETVNGKGLKAEKLYTAYSI